MPIDELRVAAPLGNRPLQIVALVVLALTYLPVDPFNHALLRLFRGLARHVDLLVELGQADHS